MAKLNISSETGDFNWIHYVQVEIRQRQIKEELEATLREMESTPPEERPQPQRRTLWQFLVSKRRKSGEEADAATPPANDIESVKNRIRDADTAMAINHRELHDQLHRWLNMTDEKYKFAAEVERLHHQVAVALLPMPAQFIEMRARYGCARNEIGVAYNQDTGTLSPTGQASVDRLIVSYDVLIHSEETLVDAINTLNKRLENSIFVKMRLPEFRMVIAPDCRPGMPYSEMRANFERGAAQVTQALDDLEGYVKRLNRADYDRESILREYRESEWKRRLYMMAAAAV